MKLPSTWKGRLLLGFPCLALAWCLLLIPDPTPPSPIPAAGKPFEWRQDQLWRTLETQFVEARKTPTNEVSRKVEAGLASLGALINGLTNAPLRPDASVWPQIEAQLFSLSPWLATWSSNIHTNAHQDFFRTVARLRAAVKRHSQTWDLGQPQARQTLYRQLYGSRIALEEILLQAPSTNLIPTLMTYEQEAEQINGPPTLQYDGVQLQSGDILVSRGGAPTSALIARGNDYPGSFSHVALLHVDKMTGQGTVIESVIERGVIEVPFEHYLKEKRLRLMVLRLRSDLPQVQANPWLPYWASLHALESVGKRHIPYDFSMDGADNTAQFCSEVALDAYAHLGLKLWTGMTHISSPTLSAWLGSVGVRHFTTQEPADLEYDQQVRIVAEWRNPATLFKAHVDDVVTDAMLEAAAPGKPLPHSPVLLPVYRIVKGYSAALNLVGLTGPIPEGMSATVAMRADRYRSAHTKIAERVLADAEAFQKQHGYRPPFWVLLDLATKAVRDLRK